MDMTRINSTKQIATSVALLTFVGWSGVAAGQEVVAKTTAVAPKIPGKTRLVHLPLTQVTVIAARKGWMQEEFSKYNAKFDLVDTSAFPQASAAAIMDRGDLHITRAMFNFALQYPANGFDTVDIWGSTVVDRRRAQTVVLKESDIQSVEQLKGHTLASSVLGCPYYASMEALRSHGVTVDNDFGKGDMRFVNISGAGATSAFLAGRFEAFAIHPATNTTASLYIQDQVRTLTTAVPDGIYVNSGGRSMEFALRRWVNENPDLVKAFLTVQDRVVRWLDSDHGAHFDEAASIVAREMRYPKAIALFSLKDKSQTNWEYGETDPDKLYNALKTYRDYQVSVKDPLYTKAKLTDKLIAGTVDRRFFAGGEYFVDSGEKKKTDGAKGALLNGGAEPSTTKLAVAKTGR
jgi:sulfonate transport system substrate-binding protein